MKNHSTRKIITPTQLPQQSTAGTAWAEHLSNTFQAQLLLYNAVRPVSADGNLYTTIHGNKINALLKSATERLRHLGSSLSRAYKVNYLIEVSSHWRNLILQTAIEKADLMVVEMPTSGTPTSGRLNALMYESACPVLFVQEGMPVKHPAKILVPVRIKDGLEQKLPAITAWATASGASVHLSAFAADGTSSSERIRLYGLQERMSQALRAAGVRTESETAHGHHFGTTMVQRAKLIGADLIAIAVEPGHFLSRLFTKMIGPYFLENSPVPVLSIPLAIKETSPTALDTLPAAVAPPNAVALGG